MVNQKLKVVEHYKLFLERHVCLWSRGLSIVAEVNGKSLSS